MRQRQAEQTVWRNGELVAPLPEVQSEQEEYLRSITEASGRIERGEPSLEEQAAREEREQAAELLRDAEIVGAQLGAARIGGSRRSTPRKDVVECLALAGIEDEAA